VNTCEELKDVFCFNPQCSLISGIKYNYFCNYVLFFYLFFIFWLLVMYLLVKFWVASDKCQNIYILALNLHFLIS
jgi:hypothetical protein